MATTIYAKTEQTVLQYSGSSFDGATEYSISNMQLSQITSNISKITSFEFIGGTLVESDGYASMFNGCNSLTYIDLSGFISSAFKQSNIPGKVNKIKLGAALNFYTGLASAGWGITDGKLTVIGTTPFKNLGNSISGLFEHCRYRSVDLSGLYVNGTITSIRRLFRDCPYLRSADLSMLDLTKLDSEYSMQWSFASCPVLEEVNFGNIFLYPTYSDTSSTFYQSGQSGFRLKLKGKVTSNMLAYLFAGSHYQTFDTTEFEWNWDSIISIKHMYYGCKNLTFLNLSDWKFTAITTPDGCFGGCQNLASVIIGKINKLGPASTEGIFYQSGTNQKSLSFILLDWSNITSFHSMFNYSRYTDIEFQNEQNKVSINKSINFLNLCYQATQLVNIDMSNICNKGTTTWDNAFLGCTSLRYIYLGGFKSFGGSTIMSGAGGSGSGILNIYMEDTTFLTTMTNAFAYSNFGQININFDMEEVTNINQMFYQCSKLLKIYSNNIPKKGSYTGVFTNCTMLTGPGGFKYSSSKTSSVYARVGSDSVEGYFWGQYEGASGIVVNINPTGSATIKSRWDDREKMFTFDVDYDADQYVFNNFYYYEPSSVTAKGYTKNLTQARVVGGKTGTYKAYFNFTSAAQSGQEYNKGSELSDLEIKSDKITDSKPSNWMQHGDTDMYCIFIPTPAQLKDFASWLYQTDFISSMSQALQNVLGFNTDLTQLMYSFKVFPFDISPAGNKYFKIGWASPSDTVIGQMSQQGKMLYTLNNVYELDCGTLYFERVYDNALDYQCHVQIYLPFVGMQVLESYDVIGKNIRPVYQIDLLTGDCVCKIFIDDSIKYQFTGNCGYDMPLSQVSQNGVLSKGLQGAMMLGAAAGVIPPLNITGQTITEEKSKINYSRVNPGQVSSQTKEVTQTHQSPLVTAKEAIGGFTNLSSGIVRGGSLQGNTGFLGTNTPYLLVSYPRLNVPTNFGHFNGYPCNKTLKLGELTGYTQVGEMHLDGFTGTDAEAAEIESMLKGGVYL